MARNNWITRTAKIRKYNTMVVVTDLTAEVQKPEIVNMDISMIASKKNLKNVEKAVKETVELMSDAAKTYAFVKVNDTEKYKESTNVYGKPVEWFIANTEIIGGDDYEGSDGEEVDIKQAQESEPEETKGKKADKAGA